MSKQVPNILEKLIIALVLVLANLRASIFIFLFPDTTKILGPAWIEILLWIFAISGVLYLLLRQDKLNDYLSAWQKNRVLAFFVSLAFISILWSIAPVATLFRGLELIFATLVGAYFGLRLRSEQWLELLFWFGAGVFILSIALVFGAPKTGTMYWAPFDGAWRGVYWHRNHLASITALLSAANLCRALVAFQTRDGKGILDVFFYIISLSILYFAKSATGYIVFLVLNFLVSGIWIWLKIYGRLRRWHYVAGLGGIVALSLIGALNLDFIFGMFHRDTTLTGRTSLWSQLLKIGSERFWFGHGFGAIWTLDSFREQIKVLAKWTSQPLIADNGFLDIFLHLGVIGLLVFLGVLMLASVRAVRYALVGKNLPAFFPLLVMVYAVVGNITFSLFAEAEVFVWFLIVAVLFITIASPRATTATTS